MNVILQGDGSPFGVLEVDSRSDGEFNEKDIAFLQGAANILGMAIERQRYERKLQAALDRHEVLLSEINHRTKNSLQIVASMLHMQANSASDPELQSGLLEGARRISTVGRAYERLAYDGDRQKIDLGAYLDAVIRDLETAEDPITLHFDAESKVNLASDRAILVALLINELIANAMKYAYPNGTGGPIRVHLSRLDPDTAAISVRDEGVGLPADFEPGKSKRLGTRLVAAFTAQLGAELTSSSSAGGAEFLLRVPLG